ncbi:MAG: hypothetical protein A4E55_01451 [Pelotomaculum sp. PtaU1.Bin035]|nr:MAG: hypothetical protein A4E55_01451 [Pelotomaculum sp. PtaU1.Bin035]
MNVFTWLLVGHLAGDFLLQTGWMAKKVFNTTSLLVHCFVYTMTIFIMALPAGGLSVTALSVIFISHFILDQRNFVNFWVRRVNNAENLQWMNIAVDQSFHLLVLAIVSGYLN